MSAFRQAFNNSISFSFVLLFMDSVPYVLVFGLELDRGLVKLVEGGEDIQDFLAQGIFGELPFEGFLLKVELLNLQMG